jgi:hypothetical protein
LGGGSGTSFRPVLAMYEGCVREGVGGGGGGGCVVKCNCVTWKEKNN